MGLSLISLQSIPFDTFPQDTDPLLISEARFKLKKQRKRPNVSLHLLLLFCSHDAFPSSDLCLWSKSYFLLSPAFLAVAGMKIRALVTSTFNKASPPAALHSLNTYPTCVYGLRWVGGGEGCTRSCASVRWSTRGCGHVKGNSNKDDEVNGHLFIV